MKYTKKGDISFLTIILIVTIISGGMLAFFIFDSNETISKTLDDIQCRGLIFAKDYSKLPALDIFLWEITQKCKVDSIIIENSKTGDESFEEIAQTMQRCWYRYGNGEKDFLSAWDTTGQWCFECARIEFENKGDIYSYSDFILWMNSNFFINSSGEKMSYLNSLNVISYSHSEDQIFQRDFSNILNKLEIELKNDGEISQEDINHYNDILLGLSNNINSFKYKQINTNENNFVVYRYDRIKRDLYDTIEDSLSTTEEVAIKYGGTIGITYALTSPFSFSKKVASGVSSASASVKNIDGTVSNLKNSIKSSKTYSKLALKVLRRSPLIGTIIFGFDNHNTNYIQYVDIMTQEEYYRSCGTERRIVGN